MAALVLATTGDVVVREWVRSQPILAGLVFNVAILAFAFGVAHLTSRDRDPQIRADDNVMRAGVSAVAILFAFFAAVTAAEALSFYNAAIEATEQEAAQLTALRDDFLLEEGALAEAAPEVVGLIRNYVEIVVEDEWPLMANQERSPAAAAALDELVVTVNSIQPQLSSLGDEQRFGRALATLDQFVDARGVRLLSGSQGAPPVVWLFLLVNLIVLVGMAASFPRNPLTWLKGLVLVGLTVVSLTALFTILELENPYDGSFIVEPAFDQVLPASDTDGS